MVGSENLQISLQDLTWTVVVMVYGTSHVKLVQAAFSFLCVIAQLRLDALLVFR